MFGKANAHALIRPTGQWHKTARQTMCGIAAPEVSSVYSIFLFRENAVPLTNSTQGNWATYASSSRYLCRSWEVAATTPEDSRPTLSKES